MIRFALPLIALAGTAACHPDTSGPRSLPAPPAGAKCDVSGMGDLVGKTRSTAVEKDALKRSGAATVRWITPDMMVTMDFREDRLNIHLGTDGKIGSVRCG